MVFIVTNVLAVIIMSLGELVLVGKKRAAITGRPSYRLKRFPTPRRPLLPTYGLAGAGVPVTGGGVVPGAPNSTDGASRLPGFVT